MTTKEMSRKMRAAFVAAESLSSHDFGIFGVRPKETASPQLSPAGQYFYRCHRCSRSVFDDGTGTAAESTCKA